METFGQRISSSQRCCHRYETFRVLSFEGHGWPVQQHAKKTETAAQCGRACHDNNRCMFYSHDSEQRCYLCATCELRSPASQWSEELRFRWLKKALKALAHNNHSALTSTVADSLFREPVVASSWARSSMPFVRMGAIPTPVSRLRYWLDSPAYTTAIYGPGGSVPATSDLRLIWLSLLPKAALREIGSVGVCGRVAPVPPLQPFFAYIGITENPTNAMWIARPILRPAPPNSWCGQHCMRRFMHAPCSAFAPTDIARPPTRI